MLTAGFSIKLFMLFVWLSPRGSAASAERHYLDEDTDVSWKKFCVRLAGKTNGAHLPIVAKLQAIGQTEVYTDGESDYLLVFCPIASRVGTDISEALDNIPGDKPVILVVMHHTFSPDRVVAESRRLVDNPNVHLTVDCLFYEGKLLNPCDRNDIALFEVQTFFGVSTAQISKLQNNNWFLKYRRTLFVVVSVCFCALLILVIYFSVKK